MANTPKTGGYDCKFVETPPDKLMCQICQAVARSPHQVTCCGKLYCKACLDEHKKHSSICPNCSKRGMPNFCDAICEKDIKSLKVKCHNSKNGCVWKGKLQSLDDHLTTCEYILIRCTNKCMNTDMKEVYVLRCNLDVHLKDRCPNRQYSCPYCKVSGRRCDMTTDTHFNVCPKIKVTCPNNDCMASVLRCDLADHRSKCQFEMVQCKYAGIGCEKELIRKDQEQHESNDTFHLHLAIETVNELQKKMNRQQEINVQHEESKKQLEAIDAQHEKSKKQWEEIKKQREESKKQREEIDKQRAESKKQREEIDKQREEIDKQRAESKNLREEIDKQRTEIDKQREEIDKQREEIDKQRAESKNLREEIDKQRTESKKQREEIDKQRAESKEQREKIDKQRKDIDKQQAESKKQWEEIEKQQAEGKKQREEFEKQQAEGKKQREEINEQLQEVKGTSENIVAGQGGSCVFKFPKFNQHKSSKEEWFSPPFYTQPGGYKMCIRIDANGFDEGKSTHVSVYARLMRGRNDDNLPWPFTGRVTITLLNQLADRHHHKRTISFSQGNNIAVCERVVDGEMATIGYGEPKFISHTQLDAQPSFQYLKDHCLYFRIEVQASKPVKPWLTCTV